MFNERMKSARQDAELSLEQAALRAHEYDKRVTIPRIRTLEANGQEATADPLFVWALAQVYGVSVRELSDVVADRLNEFLDLATRQYQLSLFDQQVSLPWAFAA